MVGIKVGIGLATACLAAVTACSSAPVNGTTAGNSHSKQSMSVAGILPLSGASAPFGEENLLGMRIGVDAANAGVGGITTKLNLVPLDSQALPSPALQGMNEAVHVKQTPVVLTAFSSLTEALAPIANQTKTVLIQGGASSPALAKLGPYVFNTLPLANEQLPALVDYLVKVKKLTRWTIEYDNETLGESLLAVLKTLIPEAGAKIVGEVGTDTTQSDFSSTAAKIRATNADIVFLGSAGSAENAETTLISQLREGGVTAQLAAYAGTDSPEVVALKGAQGMILTGETLQSDNQDEFTKFFNRELAKLQPGTAANSAIVNYANSVIIAAIAADYAKSHGEPINGQTIASAMHAIKNFNVIDGAVDFQPDGTVLTPINVLQIVDGKEQILKTYPIGGGIK
jgi:branched-chain amino acid transport system substrate-binding protein